MARARKPERLSAVDAAKTDDGLGVLKAMRLRLAEIMDAATAENANVVPQVAGQLQKVNREIDERLGLLSPPDESDDEEPDDDLAKLRKRAAGR